MRREKVASRVANCSVQRLYEDLECLNEMDYSKKNKPSDFDNIKLCDNVREPINTNSNGNLLQNEICKRQKCEFALRLVLNELFGLRRYMNKMGLQYPEGLVRHEDAFYGANIKGEDGNKQSGVEKQSKIEPIEKLQRKAEPDRTIIETRDGESFHKEEQNTNRKARRGFLIHYLIKYSKFKN
ncbi:hypothetical protein ACOME3_004369 [Neoechinorhynchus agilis]